MTTYTAKEFVYLPFLWTTLVGFHFDTSNVIKCCEIDFFTNIGPKFFNQNVPFLLTALVGFHFDISNVIYNLMLLNRFFTDISPKFFNQKSPL